MNIKDLLKNLQSSVVTIVEPVSSAGSLNALQKKTFQKVKSVSCFWNESNKEKHTETGERQEYIAFCMFLESDVFDVKDKINQFVRVAFGDIDSWLDSDLWLVETIEKKYLSLGKGKPTSCSIEMKLKKPFSGNNVRV